MRNASLVLVTSGLLSACVVVSEPSYAKVPPMAAQAEAGQAASGKYGPEPGDSILQLGGAITSQTQDVAGNSTTNTSIALQGGIGWFHNEWLEYGGQVLGNWSLPDGGSDTVLVSIAPYANANFKVEPRVWLYVGPHAGLAYLDFSNDTASSFAYGLHGGARYWLTPRASLFGEGRYTRSTFSILNTDIDSDTFELLFGFNLVF